MYMPEWWPKRLCNYPTLEMMSILEICENLHAYTTGSYDICNKDTILGWVRALKWKKAHFIEPISYYDCNIYNLISTCLEEYYCRFPNE